MKSDTYTFTVPLYSVNVKKKSIKLLRKYEVCGRLLFDGRGVGEYNGCIELVGKLGYNWGILPANAPSIVSNLPADLCGSPVFRRAVKKEKEEQT